MDDTRPKRARSSVEIDASAWVQRESEARANSHRTAGLVILVTLYYLSVAVIGPIALRANLEREIAAQGQALPLVTDLRALRSRYRAFVLPPVSDRTVAATQLTYFRDVLVPRLRSANDLMQDDAPARVLTQQLNQLDDAVNRLIALYRDYRRARQAQEANGIPMEEEALGNGLGGTSNTDPLDRLDALHDLKCAIASLVNLSKSRHDSALAAIARNAGIRIDDTITASLPPFQQLATYVPSELSGDPIRAHSFEDALSMVRTRFGAATLPDVERAVRTLEESIAEMTARASARDVTLPLIGASVDRPAFMALMPAVALVLLYLLNSQLAELSSMRAMLLASPYAPLARPAHSDAPSARSRVLCNVPLHARRVLGACLIMVPAALWLGVATSFAITFGTLHLSPYAHAAVVLFQAIVLAFSLTEVLVLYGRRAVVAG